MKSNHVTQHNEYWFYGVLVHCNWNKRTCKSSLGSTSLHHGFMSGKDVLQTQIPLLHQPDLSIIQTGWILKYFLPWIPLSELMIFHAYLHSLVSSNVMEKKKLLSENLSLRRLRFFFNFAAVFSGKLRVNSSQSENNPILSSNFFHYRLLDELICSLFFSIRRVVL